jgi:predicted aspartyl protease
VGKINVKIKLTNLFDLALYSRKASTRKPRQVEVESLVDTGATRLYLKPSVIKKLGLQRVDAVRSQTTNGEAIRFKYEPVQLELMGRRENFDVIEEPESVPNLRGRFHWRFWTWSLIASGRSSSPIQPTAASR